MKSGQPRPIKIRRNFGPIKPITKVKDSEKYDKNNKDWLTRQHKEFGIE